MTRTVDHIAGQTFHGRKGDVQNAFRYSVDYVLLEPEVDSNMPGLFSRNRRNVLSLHDSDHGGAPKAGTGAVWVRDVLEKYQVQGIGSILLLAQPRVFGHVFNPVCFWLCYGETGDLIAVIAEVSNTFGDRHSYLCHHADLSPIRAEDRLPAQKIFHVSPFQPVGGGYLFRFDIRDDQIGIWIDYDRPEGGLLATLTGARRPLTNARILRSLVCRPFGSRRVLGLIHWQALKLWWKNAHYRARPAPPSKEVSR